MDDFEKKLAATAAAGAPEKIVIKRSENQPLRRSTHSGSFERWHLNSEPPVEEDGWLLTYLDVITLLLVMMIVMLTFTEPSDTPSKTKGKSNAFMAAMSQAKSKKPTGSSEATAKDLGLDNLGDGIDVVVQEGVVSFRISSEILFASGESELTAKGKLVVNKLLPVFNKAGSHQVVVEGHTDNVPIRSAQFPSNWELSSARASSVVRHLETQGVISKRMRAVGYAETRPMQSNLTGIGRSVNRRVEIVMEAPKASASQDAQQE